MAYLLNLNLSEWKSRKIPSTKMKIETMRDQLPNPIRFIIDYVSSWEALRDEDKVASPSHASLYQKYLEWCEGNGEKPLASKVARKKFSEIGIESKQTRTGGGKREWQYILDRSKIVVKIREKVGDLEEFSDIPQDELPANEATDIPIFNVPETIPQKTIPPQPEPDVKSTPPSSSRKDKKADKQDESTQPLFDYVAEDTHAPVASTSGTSETSKTPEPVIDEPESKNNPPDSIKPTNEISPTILSSRSLASN